MEQKDVRIDADSRKATDAMRDKLRTWVVNDYFTPNIKAEVILDMLLTQYVAEIVNRQCGLNTVFITKEMSVDDETQRNLNAAYGNMGTKIDYILADREAVYLVELKTTDSSIDKTQADRYLTNCKDRTFGEVFGRKLLEIVRDSFAETYANKFVQDCGNEPDSWDESSLSKAFHLVFTTWYLGKKYNIADPSRKYARTAMELIKTAGWAQSDSCRSRKYLYTMGQLMDYMYPENGEHQPLWDLPLKLIYITPTGALPHGALEEEGVKPGEAFYCRSKGKGSVSLVEAKKCLSEKSGDELAQLLVEVITDIYKR